MLKRIYPIEGWVESTRAKSIWIGWDRISFNRPRLNQLRSNRLESTWTKSWDKWSRIESRAKLN